MADDGLTQREKRAQRHKVEARKGAPGRLARKAIVPTLIILVLAGIAAGFYFTSKNAQACPSHWHSTFDVYVQEGNGTRRVNFRHPSFDLNGQTPLRAHMHQGDGKNQLHFEGGGVCVGVEEAFRYVDVDLEGNSIRFTGIHEDLGQDGTFREEGNKTLEVYIESPEGVWRHPSVGSILDYQLKDGERILILYGSFTDEQVAEFQAAMPVPDSGRPAPQFGP
jgi:hypothetical protein